MLKMTDKSISERHSVNFITNNRALTKEESELTAINGFRAGYKHVMVGGDSFPEGNHSNCR